MKKRKSQYQLSTEHDKKAKRVCIIKQGYYPQYSHVLKDAETLTKHGYEVDIICLRSKGQKSHEVVQGVNVHRLPLERHRSGIMRYIYEYTYFFLLTFWQLTCLSLTRRYKVVEVDNLPDFLVFTTLVPKLLGAKIVLYFFELMPEVFADQFNVDSNHVTIKLLRGLEKISANWADRIIAANGICQYEILKGRGIPASKMSMVLNVPDDNIMSRQSSRGNDNGVFRLITHTSLLKRYGVQTLIKAVPLLKKEIPQLEIKVLGAGEYRPQLEELSQSLGAMDCVHFAGYVSVEEMLSCIAKAHIGIMSLLPQKQPQMPNKLFDYLAIGTPVVATSLPAIIPYLNENSVMYYKPDDENDLARCILELYRNTGKRAALAASGSTDYQKYRWSVMKYEYLKVYEQLVNGKKQALSGKKPAVPG